ncbi:MAG: nicotinamidase [archaeon]|nr:nicotinamidase [archaeon]
MVVSVTPVEPRRALLVIDVQYDFLPGGALAVAGGDQVLPVIDWVRTKRQWDMVVFSQDWHPTSHVSFASSHGDLPVNSVMELSYTSAGDLCAGPNIMPSYSVPCVPSDVSMVLNQTLWPVHCLQNSPGAMLSKALLRLPSDPVVQKGYHVQIDSYSAFWDNGHMFPTALQGILQQANITEIFVAGLALDFCVFYTSMDGNALGYRTYVIQDASRGISPQGVDQALSQMRASGITIVNATQIPHSDDDSNAAVKLA